MLIEERSYQEYISNNPAQKIKIQRNEDRQNNKISFYLQEVSENPPRHKLMACPPGRISSSSSLRCQHFDCPGAVVIEHGLALEVVSAKLIYEMTDFSGGCFNVSLN